MYKIFWKTNLSRTKFDTKLLCTNYCLESKRDDKKQNKGFATCEWSDQIKARPCFQIHKGCSHGDFVFILNLADILFILLLSERLKIANTSIQIYMRMCFCCMHMLGAEIHYTKVLILTCHDMLEYKTNRASWGSSQTRGGLHKSMSGIITYLLMKNQSTILETKNQNLIINILKIWTIFTEENIY